MHLVKHEQRRLACFLSPCTWTCCALHMQSFTMRHLMLLVWRQELIAIQGKAQLA